MDGIRELREDKHLLVTVAFGQEIQKGGEFFVPVRVPRAAMLQELNEGLGVSRQILGEIVDKKVRPEPLEATMVVLGVVVVNLSGACLEIDGSFQSFD